MKELRKTLRVTLFGIKNSRVFFILMLLLCCVFIPTFIYLGISETHPKLTAVEISVVGAVAAYAGGIFAPVMLFSFLHNRTEQDLYIAMPVKRIQYFIGYALSGFLMFILPYTLMIAICGLIPNDGGLWQDYLTPVGMYFVLFSSLTLCMTFCTSGAGSAVSFVLRNGLAASLVILPFTLANLDSQAYFDFLSDKILMLTPLGTCISLFRDYGHILPVQLVIALGELILSCFLFIGRKNEVSLALAFPKSRYFYQYSVLTVAGLYITALFMSMFGLGSGQYYDDMPYVVFFSVACTFMVFIVLNIILEKNSKAAFHKLRHFFIFIAGFALVTTSVVSLLISLVPYSVIPFYPEFAVVKIYSVERNYSQEDIYRNHININIYSSETNDYIDERAKYHAVYDKSLIVTDAAKLKALTELAQKPSRYYDNRYSYKSLSLLSSHLQWQNTVLNFEDEVPEELKAVEITFYNVKANFGGEITEKALEELTSRPFFSGIYRQSTRYGFGIGEEYISGFTDVAVK